MPIKILRSRNRAKKAATLRLISAIALISLAGNEGQVLFSTVENPDPHAASRPYFLWALAEETHISEPSLLGSSKRAVIYCSAPVPHPKGKGAMIVVSARWP